MGLNMQEHYRQPYLDWNANHGHHKHLTSILTQTSTDSPTTAWKMPAIIAEILWAVNILSDHGATPLILMSNWIIVTFLHVMVMKYVI